MSGNGPILIAGAGIGGLTLALALANRAAPSIVVERTAHPEPLGAGIQLSPNAGRVLDRLGLGRDLDQVASHPVAVEVASGRTGRRSGEIPLGCVAGRRYGAPYRVLHRADLHAVLLAAATRSPHVTLRFGETVTGLDPAQPEITTTDLSGTSDSLRGRLVVGADGVRSTLGARLGLPAATRSGLTAWRAMLPARDVEGAVTRLWLHERGHLVAYSVAGGRSMNLVLVLGEDAAAEEGTAPAIHLDEWAETPRRLIEAATSWSPWPLLVRRAKTGWSGAVTLLGDAVHPMLPFLAQGAAMAIEDAAVLTAALARAPAEQAARRYEQERLVRWRRVQDAAARTGRIYHLGRAAALARDAGMQLLPAGLRLAPYDWLFGWRPPD